MRTEDEFLQHVAKDLVWRRKELTEMRALVQSAQGELRQSVLIRSSVALLYAHWEGFVKAAASAYLKFVAYQGVDCEQLAHNFLALAARASSSGQDGPSADIKIAAFYAACDGVRARIPFKGVIGTKSNLGSAVLKDILVVLGLPEASFTTKMALIDTSLVNRRNHIAHGEYLSISVTDYEGLHQEVLGLIEAFRNEVENAAVTKKYLRI